MRRSLVNHYLRHRGVKPLVRPTRNQAEIELLPPYGDPEVHLVGEIATYLIAGAVLTELLNWVGPD